MLLAVSANQRASERWGVSVIYFNKFQYNKAVEQRRVDPVVRTGPKSVLTLSRMVLVSFEKTELNRPNLPLRVSS